MTDKQVYIFDTTLRDGQQCPGAGMGFDENLEYAELTHKLGIDIVEAGFPAASTADFEIVYEIAKLFADREDAPTVAALCQLRSEQIDKTIESLQPSIEAGKVARLHTYVPVDPNLMPPSLGSLADDKPAINNMVGEFVERAVKAGLEVQFSPEGYSRQGENFDFTTDLIRTAIGAGARVINCPDTIGGACSYQDKRYYVHALNKHAEIMSREFPDKDIVWSVHCHNDFGLAVINSINGVLQGPATQIEGCINGVGERAGNAALEQCIMILKHFAEGYYTRANPEYIQEISNFVNHHMLPRQPHWPICGDNAARHSSGGHTNAILKSINVYQPFNPEETGNKVSLLFGPLSGGNHAKSIVEEAGYICKEEEKAEVAQFIKDHYKDRRKGITEGELLNAYFEYRQPITVHSFDYSKSANQSAVHLEGNFFDQSGKIDAVHEGRDSALAALKAAIDEYLPGFQIQKHQSHSEGHGIQARSVSTIVLVDESSNEYIGYGKDRDIEISAMKALINASNRAYVERNYRNVA